MRTLYNNTAAKRISILAQKGEEIFHLRDLANLWEIKDPNTLRMTLKRYCKSELLFRIFRGFYSLKPIENLDAKKLGAKALSRFCYLSTETVLFEEGIIAQPPSAITFVSDISKVFAVAGNNYKSRKMAEKFLYNSEGIFVKDGIRRATALRAAADMLYFNAKYHFDRQPDWKKIIQIQKIIGYPLTPNRYDAPKTK